MGKQSTSPFFLNIRVVLRTSLLFPLIFAASPVSAAQTTAQISALTVPLLLPSAVVFDASGNLYLAETANHVIRKVDTAGHITTIAGTGTQGFSGDNGFAAAATLDSPQGLALDTAGNLYIADTHNQRIRRIDATTQIITTVAGTGNAGFSGDTAAAATAQLNLPTALAFDIANNLYFADTANHRIRRIDATTQIITTVAGTGREGFSGDTGQATAADIDSPAGLAFDSNNNLYLADTHNHRIRCIDATTQIITTIAGTGTPGFSGDTGAATGATLALPHGLTVDANGNLYLADTANHRIRRIDATAGIITTIAGNGIQGFSGDNASATMASLDSPRAAAVSPASLVTLSDTNNQRVRQLTAAPAPATAIQTIAGLGVTAPGALTLTAPSVVAYGTGQITATLSSDTAATGVITFFNTTSNGTDTLGTATVSSNTATLPTTVLPAGTYNITATYAGDQTHLAAQSSTLPLTVAPQQLTVTLAPITLFYGQAIPAIAGTLNGVLPQDTANIVATFATTASTLSPAGTYAISGTLTGAAAGNYTLAPLTATVAINPAPTVITITNLTSNATTTSPVALTATVASTTSGTPTGSVTLLDNGNPISTQPLLNGIAAFTIPSPTQGAHSYTALYIGSTNFASSNSTAQLITVGAGPAPDFTIAATGTTSQTILSGSSASFTFSAAFQGNLSSPITLAATGLPNLATASFNPPIVPPGSTTNTFTLTIATPNTTAENPTLEHTQSTWAFLLAPLAILAFRRRKAQTISVALLTLTLAFVNGCGDRIATADAGALPAKSYTITVTGTATTASGSILQHTATVTLLIEQPQ